MKQKGKVLGIDYGEKIIGIAISDEEQRIAFGKTSILHKGIKYVIASIKKICDEEKIVKIIIGHPLSLQGQKTEQTYIIEQFTDKLKKEITLPICYYDERLTSVESGYILNNLNVSKKKKKIEKNIIAASLILQNYLNYREEGRG